MGSDSLVTARLVLRRPRADDVDDIYRIHCDPVACAHNPSDMVASRAEAAERFERWDRHWTKHGVGYWVVTLGGRTLGFCGLKVMLLGSRPVLNLFYRLSPAAWGDGVAGEAASAVVGWAAACRAELPVIARVRPANVASAVVAQRAGLQRAAHLDTPGEDGMDEIYCVCWGGATGGQGSGPRECPEPAPLAWSARAAAGSCPLGPRRRGFRRG